MNLRQVRGKIRSFSNVKKITKAMQLVSAVKMRKAQQRAVEGRPYQTALGEIIARVLPTINKNSSLLLQRPEGAPKKELVIFVSANKGLCGAFNVNLFRLLSRHENFANMDFVTVGKKGASFVTGTRHEILADYSASSAEESSAVFDLVVKHFLDAKYEKVSLVYNQFISTLRSQSVHKTLLPLEFPDSNTSAQQHVSTDYLIEPSKEALFESLLKNYLEEKIRAAILNSEAAEHSSRMIAMKNATDNASELIYNLTLLRNKLRQQKITYELLDMITATLSVE